MNNNLKDLKRNAKDALFHDTLVVADPLVILNLLAQLKKAEAKVESFVAISNAALERAANTVQFQFSELILCNEIVAFIRALKKEVKL